MSSDAPRLVGSLVSPRPIFTGLQILAGVFLALSRRPPVEPWLGAILASLAVVETLRAVRVASTRVPDAGISQLTMRGRVYVPFADVTSVIKKPDDLTLSSQHGRVIVRVGAFENTAAAIGYIESRLPKSVERSDSLQPS